MYSGPDDNITGPTYAAIFSSPYEGYPTSDARFDNFSISSVEIPTTGFVTIGKLSMCGTGSGEADEYVEIANDNIYDIFPIQLKDWTLEDEEHNLFTFPSFLIYPGQTCRVYTNEYHPEWCGFSFGSDTEIWNVPEDHAYLRDAKGTLIANYEYSIADPPYCP